MIPKLAIEKAIEGGWNPSSRGLVENSWCGFIHPETLALIALSPEFWQALGKACGWSDDGISHELWGDKAMHFCSLILQGKDTTEFWRELLN